MIANTTARFARIAFLGILGTVAAAAEAADRVEISLNGPWEYRLVDDLDAPVPADGFRPVAVPGYLSGIDYRRAWFRRTFTLPESTRGLRVKIRFGGVKYNSRVVVNGKPVGGCFGGYRPFEVDVTGAVRFDRPNEILVGCHDWTGVFTPGRVDFSPSANWSRTRSIPTDKILAPIGGLHTLYGIWDDVSLVALRPVYVKDLFIKPSVRNGELVVDYTVANESADDAHVQLLAAVEDESGDALGLGPARLHVPAGEEVTTTVRHPWPEARLWSHVDPYLYHLRTELSSGDRLRTRFGFREFWTQGHHFYLNGTKVNLLATSWWPPHGPMTREAIAERWEAVKRCGCVAFRTHTQPWRSVHYDMADELGLLMIIEGAVWNDDYVYRIDDPLFWEHYAGHLEAMVARDKNRPSVVMWSLENELHGGRMNDEAPAKADLVRMGTLMKKWDPTRPIFYESDGDPGRVAHAIGIHYPHEYPKYTNWPNEAYWLREPASIPHHFHNGEEAFFWRRKKPLYVGEFLWIPSSNPSWHTVFFGDEAYVDYRRYRNLAKAEAWKMQILGYRHLEVAGISPWTMIEGGPLDDTNPLYQAHQYAYQPIAAFVHDRDSRFFSGEKVPRRVEVFNDITTPSQLTLTWELRIGPDRVAAGEHALSLGPAEHELLEPEVPMPRVTRRTACTWSLKLTRGGKVVFEDSHPFSVFPRTRLPKLDATVGLYDPLGTTRSRFEAAGLETVPVASLEAIDQPLDVLVVGAGTLGTKEETQQQKKENEKGKDKKEEEEDGKAKERSKKEEQGAIVGRQMTEQKTLAAFVARGGHLLILEQPSYPDGLFDVSPTDHGSTMTFPFQPGHAALEGVKPADLKFWRGDHVVSAAEVPRAALGGALPIVVSGSASGINMAPLVERFVGRGSRIHCQLKLIEKLETEPVAGRILGNLLEYLADRPLREGKTALLGGSEEYGNYLRGLGLRFDIVPNASPESDLSAYSLLVCKGALPHRVKLGPFLERGGHVLLHRPGSEAIERVNRELGIDLVVQPYSGHATRAEGDHPLLEAIAREDLHWLGEHKGIGWATTPRAADMTDGTFTKSLAGKTVGAFEIEPWKLEGGIVERREQGVTFATAGSASAKIEFPETGTYVIGLVARGTPCHGVYPMARVSIDGTPLGMVSVAKNAWHTATTFGRVEKGRRELSVAFINDGSAPGEDRNLYVDKVLLAFDPLAGKVAFLTTPPAIAAVGHGGGTLVVDLLRWDTEARNATKAARYASSLLTALGGAFPPRPGVAIECERMAPQPGMAHFSNEGPFASLACTGYISTTIRVATAGRYTLRVIASGTPAAGVYPLVAVAVGDETVGQIQLTSGNWRPYLIDVDLPKGPSEFSLFFTNDENREGEDRNLELDKVIFEGPR